MCLYIERTVQLIYNSFYYKDQQINKSHSKCARYRQHIQLILSQLSINHSPTMTFIFVRLLADSHPFDVQLRAKFKQLFFFYVHIP